MRKDTSRGSESKTNLHVGGLIAALAVCAIFVFVASRQNSGFEKGHFGWVSAHVLAIAASTSITEGRIGYTARWKTDDGDVNYFYFDRYPIWASAILRAVIGDGDDLGDQIVRGRTLMNVWFIASLAAAVFLLYGLFRDAILSLGATLLAFSSYNTALFREMIHVDQPAVFGILLSLNAVAYFEKTGRATFTIVLILFAVSLGRGYAVAPTLALWGMIHLYQDAVKCQSIKAGFVTWLQSTPFISGFLAFILLVGYLGYNVSNEAQQRNISIAETSIVSSAFRRLGINNAAYEKRSDQFSWQSHAELQLHRVSNALIPYPGFGTLELRQSVPYYTSKVGSGGHFIVFVILLCLLCITLLKGSISDRTTFLLMGLAGWLWLIPMKNLAVPHVYTTIYHTGFLLAVFSAALFWLPRYLKIGATGIIAVLFAGSILGSNSTHQYKSLEHAEITKDFENIVARLPTGDNVYIAPPHDSGRLEFRPDIVPGVPYAVAFYLRDNFLVAEGLSKFIVTRDLLSLESDKCGDLLTPRNTHVFLYELKASCTQ